MVEITERFIRTTRADHHRGPENKNLQREAGYIYADCTSLGTNLSLQSGGGPYIIAPIAETRL